MGSEPLTLDETDRRRLESHIVKGPHHWTWAQKAMTFTIDGLPYNPRRIVWVLEKGPIPAGWKIGQSCGDKWCIRLDHLNLRAAKAPRRRPAPRVRRVQRPHVLPPYPPGYRRGPVCADCGTGIASRQATRCRPCADRARTKPRLKPKPKPRKREQTRTPRPAPVLTVADTIRQFHRNGFTTATLADRFAVPAEAVRFVVLHPDWQASDAVH